MLSKKQFEDLMSKQDSYRFSTDTSSGNSWVDALNVETGTIDSGIQHSELEFYHLFLEIDAGDVAREAREDDEFTEEDIIQGLFDEWIESGSAYEHYKELVERSA